ncbi:/ acpS / Holo-[acyl-carrier-protein] synthase /:188485 Forward [Candidatus Hepatoplasma crinochetorum]|uniref:Holo-[acyl-carrier-protein] synthase n=1 Tax=Candidatus Hepatoplasma crinochetorum TaxID=295596 RepID=A0A0G7ZNI9_9MOLU|nr:/ acpS / Holo-[acyl-carrier-protein] synthase /:188485 Forward [Candidatus Hepatoplasma crinochetorum]
MENISIGIDIVENKRLNNINLIKRFLSEEEFKFFNDIKNKKEALGYASGRFAAKEAIIKAYNKEISSSNIKIVNNNYGKPIVFLDNKKVNNLFISISHEKNYTVAFAILLKN